ncbi:unknown [Choristoneura occidentalis granulovirus]|uniref:38K n=1 Tax=Choristoneura occidentalis granulovirus TaxID=364745 RepID=Q1A4M7_9BBAC|nr:unknown [Choristoneura fumiferana granulovirus]ABC61203.1 unknown [Choristoneura fumiferana granulovirus]
MENRWIIFHNNWSIVKRHILFVNKYEDVQLIDPITLNNIEYIVFQQPPKYWNLKYKQKILYAKDEMQDFRLKFKTAFKISYIGHIFTLYVRPATFDLLNEWLVFDVNEINALAMRSVAFFEIPHVVVFDMDSTLITEEEEVRIRDDAIYKSLDELKMHNCILCLWSYGNREHVVHSLDKVKLNGYFDIILSEGRRIGEYSVNEEEDQQYDVFYKSTPFYLDITDFKNLPKSPKVVLWYLHKHNVNLIKSITLVDDLPDNNISYDNFVNLNICPVPVDDWQKWHNQILKYIINYEKNFI